MSQVTTTLPKECDGKRRKKLKEDIVTPSHQAGERCLKSCINIIASKIISFFEILAWQSELIWSYTVIQLIEGKLGLGHHSAMWVSRDSFVFYPLRSSLWQRKSFLGRFGSHSPIIHPQRLIAQILMEKKSLLSKLLGISIKPFCCCLYIFFLLLYIDCWSHHHPSYISFTVAR